MSTTPEPQRRLEWPHGPQPIASDDDADVADPHGHWLADDAAGSVPEAGETVAARLLRDARRWAPQHGAAGRSESALPGAFFPLEAEPPALPGFRPGPVEQQEARAEKITGRVLAREIIETALLAILVFLAVRASVQHYRVEGHSMDPTLEDGEFLLVNSLLYSKIDVQALARWVPSWDPGEPAERHVFHGPERGDIVILHHPVTGQERDLVKRVIGIPGDTLRIRDGVVYINGRELIEPYVREPWRGDLPEVRIPAGSYFVMGDNRNNSLDSRVFGPVREELIVGKAMASWWPTNKIGRAPNEEPQLAPVP
ncbi:MAG: signal peptidase I [Dehalococcoidia bacterium]|nr:signal peptidase I [Dehalococcoidia bacterium]